MMNKNVFSKKLSNRLSTFLMIFILSIFTTMALATTSNQALSNPNLTKDFIEQTEVKAFIADMAKRHQFKEDYLVSLFKATKPEPKIIQLISKPYEALPWYRYRERMITDERVQKGLAFWNAQENSLKKAEAEYGIPPEIIVAIIGVETSYGQTMGKYPVLQSLSTLAFRYPPRAKFFKQELEQFLLLCREEGLDPAAIYGSYAGAIGFPQFIPSSYRRYAIDFTGKGQRDLVGNPMDAIGSVANYFKAHGWKVNEPIAMPAEAKSQRYLKLNTKDISPKYTLKELAQFDVYPANQNPQVPADERTTLITLKQKENNEHWIGLKNFYVITRYNHSLHYAMAVYQLSQKLRAAKNGSSSASNLN